MRHATIIVATLAFVPLASVTAQVQPGERVRVTHVPFCPPAFSCVAPPRKSVGTLLSVSGDTLLLSTDGGAGRVFLPLTLVRRIQVIRGRKPARREGAFIGALAGGVIGLVAAFTTYEECEGFCPADFGLGGTALVGGFLGGGLGAGVGLLVGNFLTVDDWVDVPLDQLRVSFAPHRDGRFALGFNVAF